MHLFPSDTDSQNCWMRSQDARKNKKRAIIRDKRGIHTGTASSISNLEPANWGDMEINDAQDLSEPSLVTGSQSILSLSDQDSGRIETTAPPSEGQGPTTITGDVGNCANQPESKGVSNASGPPRGGERASTLSASDGRGGVAPAVGHPATKRGGTVGGSALPAEAAEGRLAAGSGGEPRAASDVDVEGNPGGGDAKAAGVGMDATLPSESLAPSIITGDVFSDARDPPSTTGEAATPSEDRGPSAITGDVGPPSEGQDEQAANFVDDQAPRLHSTGTKVSLRRVNFTRDRESLQQGVSRLERYRCRLRRKRRLLRARFSCLTAICETEERDAAADTLQTFTRSTVLPVVYAKKSRASVVIQSAARSIASRREFKARIKSSITIQSAIRSYQSRERQSICTMKTIAAVSIQSFARLVSCRRAYLIVVKASIVVQSVARTYQVRQQLAASSPTSHNARSPTTHGSDLRVCCGKPRAKRKKKCRQQSDRSSMLRRSMRTRRKPDYYSGVTAHSGSRRPGATEPSVGTSQSSTLRRSTRTQRKPVCFIPGRF